MQDIGFTRTTPHTLVGLFRQKKSTLDQIGILFSLANLRTMLHQAVERRIDQPLVFRTISHIRYSFNPFVLIGRQRCAHFGFDLVAERIVVFQRLLHGITALSELLIPV